MNVLADPALQARIDAVQAPCRRRHRRPDLLRERDLREMLKPIEGPIDLMDIWTAMVIPALVLIDPHVLAR